MPSRRWPLACAGAATALLALGACVPRGAPPGPVPPPAPAPGPAPPAPPPPVPVPPPADWQTGPLSAGDWRYTPSPGTLGTPLALFRSDSLTFAIRCQPGRAIWLGVTGAQADALVIRTSYGVRRLPAERVHLNEMVAQLPAGDVLLEQMAFSRGRFLVTIEGGPSLVVPAYPEIGRVIEDCRGR